MHHVYILRSCSQQRETYVGYTSWTIEDRLKKHNRSEVPHTAKHVPWELAFYAAFPDKFTALAFEKYLKSHSGKAFANKRLLPPS